MNRVSFYTTVDAEVEITINDIIENLYLFDEHDINLLKKEIDNIIDVENNFKTENLLDIQKLEILKEFFNKLSLYDLENIKNKYIK